MFPNCLPFPSSSAPSSTPSPRQESSGNPLASITDLSREFMLMLGGHLICVVPPRKLREQNSLTDHQILETFRKINTNVDNWTQQVTNSQQSGRKLTLTPRVMNPEVTAVTLHILSNNALHSIVISKPGGTHTVLFDDRLPSPRALERRPSRLQVAPSAHDESTLYDAILALDDVDVPVGSAVCDAFSATNKRDYAHVGSAARNPRHSKKSRSWTPQLPEHQTVIESVPKSILQPYHSHISRFLCHLETLNKKWSDIAPKEGETCPPELERLVNDGIKDKSLNGGTRAALNDAFRLELEAEYWNMPRAQLSLEHQTVMNSVPADKVGKEYRNSIAGFLRFLETLNKKWSDIAPKEGETRPPELERLVNDGIKDESLNGGTRAALNDAFRLELKGSFSGGHCS